MPFSAIAHAARCREVHLSPLNIKNQQQSHDSAPAHGVHCFHGTSGRSWARQSTEPPTIGFQRQQGQQHIISPQRFPLCMASLLESSMNSRSRGGQYVVALPSVPLLEALVPHQTFDL